MFPKIKHMLTATLVLAAIPLALLAGPDKSADAADHRGKGHERAGMAGFGGPMAKSLNLTEAQKAQFKAIAQKHRTAAQSGNHKAQREQLRALLTAPKVDGGALRGFLNARLAEREANAGKRAAMMTEMRNVLSAEQRTKLAKSLSAGHPGKAHGKGHGKGHGEGKAKFEGKRQEMHDKLSADLKLTPAQKAAFDALQAKVAATRADASARGAGRQAFARFVETGDAAAFQASMKNRFAGKVPVNELVAVAESLNQEQRKKLLPKLASLAQFHGGHGGKGGRGHH